VSDCIKQTPSADQAPGCGANVPGTLALLRKWVDAGECLGGQVFASREGDVVADLAVGRSGAASGLFDKRCRTALLCGQADHRVLPRPGRGSRRGQLR